MPLTAIQVLKTKPTNKTKKLFDGGGMFLEITPSGCKRWRLKYRFGGKENLLSLGVYPQTTLAQARKGRDEARKLLAIGTDPSQQRKIDRINSKIAAANTFEATALEWHHTKASGWSKSHAETCLSRMKRDLFPWIGARPLTDLKPPEILALLRRIEGRGKVATSRLCQGLVSQVFNFAIATGRADGNPAASLGAALKTKLGGNHLAIIDPVRLGKMMNDIYQYTGSPITVSALKIHALTFQRPGEVSGMRWDEVDFDKALWTIPATRMKRTLQGKANGINHLVPLSRQAVEVLRELKHLTGNSLLVFAGERKGKSISTNTARMALRFMGYTDHTLHGFRATARTLIPEQLRIEKVIIERAMSHGSDESLGGAYDRTQYFDARVEMFQSWANFMDQIRIGADVVPLRRAA